MNLGILNIGIAATIIQPKIENDKLTFEIRKPISKIKEKDLTKNQYDSEMFENTRR